MGLDLNRLRNLTSIQVRALTKVLNECFEAGIRVDDKMCYKIYTISYGHLIEYLQQQLQNHLNSEVN